ncbi:hypothetical protein D3C78_1956800 [compost metagenome]
MNRYVCGIVRLNPNPIIVVCSAHVVRNANVIAFMPGIARNEYRNLPNVLKPVMVNGNVVTPVNYNATT